MPTHVGHLFSGVFVPWLRSAPLWLHLASTCVPHLPCGHASVRRAFADPWSGSRTGMTPELPLEAAALPVLVQAMIKLTYDFERLGMRADEPHHNISVRHWR